jgi:hypothetical protein
VTSSATRLPMSCVCRAQPRLPDGPSRPWGAPCRSGLANVGPRSIAPGAPRGVTDEGGAL